MRQKHNPARRGFSLVEFAIVMGVVGIIIGGIWAYATSAWDKMHSEQLMDAVTATVANVRANLYGQAGVPAVSAAALTAQLINSGAIPSNLIRPASVGGCATAPCADTPLGPVANGGVSGSGTFYVCSIPVLTAGACAAAAPGAVAQVFGVSINGLSAAQCMDIATTASLPSGPPGLLDVNINNCNMISGTGTCPSAPGGKTFPISSADANTFCNLAPPLTNVVTLDYKLRN